ncbi:uncharacterized protein LOC141910635 isoform X2 [Tubulanus polymorphus]|uniref:uncharacterized protein LOC141910635 isoform X2 n=1 Tax=Tubulanus polymorphus TaxID=672921 RepID=UPI003DA4E2E6
MMDRKAKFSLRRSTSAGQLNGLEKKITSNGDVKMTNEINQNSIAMSCEGSFGYEQPEGEAAPGTVYIRVSLPDHKTQRCIQFKLDETVWVAKQTILATLAKDLKDGLNYGLYCPPMNGKAGKFLDEERILSEYPLQEPIGFLEFKYKRKVYRVMHVNPRKLKQLHTKANLKQFMDCVRHAQIDKIVKFCNKGLDPNIHESSSGEIPLTLATSLTNPKDVIVALVNGGAHLDFRTKEGMTAMHKAAIRGNLKALKALLELGSSPNYKDKRNLTPTYYAVNNDTPALALELLLHDHGTVDSQDEQGWSEVHQACRFGRVQHLELLLFYGANMNMHNASGNTPLHVCAAHNQESCARVLLFRGANKDYINFSNQTACQVAGVVGNFELADIIRKHQPDDIVPFKETPRYNEKRRMQHNSIALMRSRSESRLDVRMLADSPDSPALSNYSLPQHYRSLTNLSDDNSSMASFQMSEHRRASICGAMSLSGMNSDTNSIYAYPRKRLYAALPGRTFVCVKDYKPTEDGELTLVKGDLVEVLSVGERGFWEGKTGNREGWFPSERVEEVKLRGIKSENLNTDAVITRRNTVATLMTEGYGDFTRTVVLQKGKQGYGFVLRGAKGSKSGQMNISNFQPTSDLPALQYLDRVDKNGNADKAGLKQGDFILEINGENVVSASHTRVVSLIKESGDVLAMKVLSKNKEKKSEKIYGSTKSMFGTSKKTREELDRAIAEHDDSSLYASYGLQDPSGKIASIKTRQNRNSTCDVTELFLRNQPPEDVDLNKSAANLEKPVISMPHTYASPAELKAQYKLKQELLQRASSSPNLLNDNDSGVECSPGSSSASAAELVASQSVVLEAIGSIKASNDSVFIQSNGPIYAEAQIHATERRRNSITLQLTNDFNRRNPSPPVPTYSAPNDEEISIPPPPSHPPPPPPTRKPQMEFVEINTSNTSDAIYMNVGELRLKHEPNPYESSFRPGTNAKFNTAPAFKQHQSHTKVSEVHYADPQDLKRDSQIQNMDNSSSQYASPAEANRFGSVKLQGEKLSHYSSSELQGVADKPSVTFADARVYDTASEFMEKHPQATLLITDSSSEAVAPKNVQNVIVLDDNSESTTDQTLPYYLPEPDYDATENSDQELRSNIKDRNYVIPVESVTTECSSTDSLKKTDVPYYYCLKKRRNSNDDRKSKEEENTMSKHSMNHKDQIINSVHSHPLFKSKDGTQHPDYYDKIVQEKIQAVSNLQQVNSVHAEVKQTSNNGSIVTDKVHSFEFETAQRTSDSSSDSSPVNNPNKVVMSSTSSFAEQLKIAAEARERRAQEHERNILSQAEKRKQSVTNDVTNPPPVSIKPPGSPAKDVEESHKISINSKPDHGNELAAAILKRHRKMSADFTDGNTIEAKILNNRQSKKQDHSEDLRHAVEQRRESLSHKPEVAVANHIEEKLAKSAGATVFSSVTIASTHAPEKQTTKVEIIPVVSSPESETSKSKISIVKKTNEEGIDKKKVDINESFTARAERLRQEYLIRKGLKLQNQTSSDSDSSTEDPALPKTKPKRFVLQKNSNGKMSYISNDSDTDAKKLPASPDAQVIHDKSQKLCPAIVQNTEQQPGILSQKSSESAGVRTLISAFQAIENGGSEENMVLPPPLAYEDLGVNIVPPPPDFAHSGEDISAFCVPPPPLDFANSDDLSITDDMESVLSTPSFSSGDSVDGHLQTCQSIKTENIYSNEPTEVNVNSGSSCVTNNKKLSPYNGSEIYEEIYAPPPPDFKDCEMQHLYEELHTNHGAFIPPPQEFDVKHSVNRFSCDSGKVQNKSEQNLSARENVINVVNVNRKLSPEIPSTKLSKSDPTPSYTKPFRVRPIRAWTTADVCDWLDSLFLSEYNHLFTSNSIDGNHLAEMTRNDFMDIGVTRVGHRMNMERSIKKALLRQDQDFVV